MVKEPGVHDRVGHVVADALLAAEEVVECDQRFDELGQDDAVRERGVGVQNGKLRLEPPKSALDDPAHDAANCVAPLVSWHGQRHSSAEGGCHGHAPGH